MMPTSDLPDTTPPGATPPDGTTLPGEDGVLHSSRRSFLKATGIAAAGFAVGGVAGGAAGAAIGSAVASDRDQTPVPLDPRREPGFDHVVVLMFENRSFDNVLGWLYTPETVPAGQTFNGLAMGEYSNTAPDGTVIDAHVYTGSTDEIMRQPDPDPGEEYPHVNTQLFGVVDPSSNSNLHLHDVQAPFNAPKPGRRPDNSGFVRDYEINYTRLSEGTAPTTKELAVAMGGFSPAMLPVFSTLARSFAVYDSWFCAVPSQTFCNRSFFHAGTSHGFVTNQGEGGYAKWLDAPATPTIFNRLEEAGLSWRVYYDEAQLISFTGVLHAPVLEKYWKTNFRTMAQYHRDVADGNLPAYAFIEPRMTFNHNDMHPPVGRLAGTEVDGVDIFNGAHSDVRAGDALLHEVYSSIRSSATPSGSNANNTLFLVTFDEHGGTYDHVAPPDAVPPSKNDGAGEMGFTFDRLGCRVPAIAISAYTQAGTVINDVMHHSAVIRTLARLHGLSPLTDRDAGANDLFNLINRSTPRPASEWPDTHPAYTPPNPEAVPEPRDEDRARPLSSPATGLLGLLVARYGEPGQPIPRSYGEAFDALTQHGQGLFGTTD
ncbi:alkaline phosphatase family protein [Glaciibacter psychrotolerans]|uniref:phospholipase C n=1 Tax=Glaciibacter psychrotolerans TaxID=670054 RepID=A0A7Z0EF65_9MICO|nr:alkaline phosphatase family protein [Leifsonia psychrotolerans]NYJ19859.1 phospholipase C [Leifsonia psychrotolerans]